MKPTEQAKAYVKLKNDQCNGLLSDGDKLTIQFAYLAGFNEALSQMQPEWVACDLANLPKENEYYSIWRKGYSPEETVARLFYHNGFKAYCFVDNSLNIYSIGEVVTHYKPLSQPPKD